MNLSITGHHLEVTPALRDYVTQKVERIRRHFDRVIDVKVLLTVDKLVQKAEITLHVKGKEIHVTSEDNDLYAAIDALTDKLDRQVVKYKEKVSSHNGEGIKQGAEQ